MNQWMKRGVFVAILSGALSMTAGAVNLNVTNTGNSATFTLTDVPQDRYAVEVTVQAQVSNAQFQSTAPVYAMTQDATAGTITLYLTAKDALNQDKTVLDLGTLQSDTPVQVKQVEQVIFLDRTLNRQEVTDVTLNAPSQPDNGNTGGSTGGSSSSGGSSTSGNKTPTVSVDGKGGRVRVGNDGTVKIIPDAGYRVKDVLVNGKSVGAVTELKDLKSTDKVVVIFEKVEETQQPQKTFTDVPATEWYAPSVQFVVERGLFQGTSENTFSPHAEMNRAMLVTVLYRMSEDDAVSAAHGFTDVPATEYYADAVAWAKANQIVSGVEATKFAPNQPITREQTAAILMRYSNYKKTQLPTSSTTPFADMAAISPYAQDAVQAMQAAGLILGRENNQFQPQAKITRAEVATILMRYVQMTEK